ncbi:MAG TPA: hypothetical protein VKW77_08580, partial [Acidimicrobiales bacterium]|nr:hypothetical protein [Acidimicrobiales bacterium]
SVTAAFCGRDGRWPPYLSGEDGYVKVLQSLCKGIIRTAAALRSARPDAVLVHVEDIGLEHPGSTDLAEAAQFAQARRWLPLDLACGRTTPDHPLHPWLLEHGATEAELDSLAASAPRWDVLGVNYYPWTSRRLVRRRDGRVRSVADSPPSGLAEVLRLVHGRYGRPVMVTETSSTGTHAERALWLRETLAAVRQARAGRVPVVGYTWFPLFTMIEWKYRWSRRGLEDHLLHLGLFDVRSCAPGRMDREPTPLVEGYQRIIAEPAAAIGEWADPAEAAAPAGLVA